MVNISELPTLNVNAVPWIPVGEGQATQSPIQMNTDVSSSPDSSECAKMDDQEFHIDWSRYSDVLGESLDDVDVLGLLNANFDTSLVLENGMVAAERPITNGLPEMGTAENHSVGATGGEPAEQASVDPQQQLEQATNSGSMECHNSGESGDGDDNDDQGELNGFSFSADWFVCNECGDHVQVVCPSGYCMPCCEMIPCGCDNQDDDYSSSNDDDYDGDYHAGDEMFAFSGTFADDEPFYDAPTADENDAPAESAPAEAEQLDGQEQLELQTAVQNSQSVKCHNCGSDSHLTQHCKGLRHMPNNTSTWKFILRLKRDGCFNTLWNQIWRLVCDWLCSGGDFTFWSLNSEPKYARQNVVLVVDEVKLRIRTTCITATPAEESDKMSALVDDDTSSISGSDKMPELVDDNTSSISGSDSSGSDSGNESSDMPEMEMIPVTVTSTNRQEVIVAGSIVDDGSQPHGQNGCQQANGLVAVVEAAIMAEVVQECISDRSHAVMAHMKWVLVQYRPIIVFRSQVSKLVCTWRQQWIEQVVALQLKYERATEARDAAARLLCEANDVGSPVGSPRSTSSQHSKRKDTPHPNVGVLLGDIEECHLPETEVVDNGLDLSALTMLGNVSTAAAEYHWLHNEPEQQRNKQPKHDTAAGAVEADHGCEAEAAPDWPAQCARHDCPCSSSCNGQQGEHCSTACRNGKACSANIHTEPFMSGVMGQHKWLELENDIKPVPREPPTAVDC